MGNELSNTSCLSSSSSCSSDKRIDDVKEPNVIKQPLSPIAEENQRVESPRDNKTSPAVHDAPSTPPSPAAQDTPPDEKKEKTTTPSCSSIESPKEEEEDPKERNDGLEEEEALADDGEQSGSPPSSPPSPPRVINFSAVAENSIIVRSRKRSADGDGRDEPIEVKLGNPSNENTRDNRKGTFPQIYRGVPGHEIDIPFELERIKHQGFDFGDSPLVFADASGNRAFIDHSKEDRVSIVDCDTGRLIKQLVLSRPDSRPDIGLGIAGVDNQGRLIAAAIKKTDDTLILSVWIQEVDDDEDEQNAKGCIFKINPLAFPAGQPVAQRPMSVPAWGRPRARNERVLRLYEAHTDAYNRIFVRFGHRIYLLDESKQTVSLTSIRFTDFQPPALTPAECSVMAINPDSSRDHSSCFCINRKLGIIITAGVVTQPSVCSRLSIWGITNGSIDTPLLATRQLAFHSVLRTIAFQIKSQGEGGGGEATARVLLMNDLLTKRFDNAVYQAVFSVNSRNEIDAFRVDINKHRPDDTPSVSSPPKERLVPEARGEMVSDDLVAPPGTHRGLAFRITSFWEETKKDGNTLLEGRRVDYYIHHADLKDAKEEEDERGERKTTTTTPSAAFLMSSSSSRNRFSSSNFLQDRLSSERTAPRRQAALPFLAAPGTSVISSVCNFAKELMPDVALHLAHDQTSNRLLVIGDTKGFGLRRLRETHAITERIALACCLLMPQTQTAL